MNTHKNHSVQFPEWLADLNKVTDMILAETEIDVTKQAILTFLGDHLGAFGAVYLSIDPQHTNLQLESFSKTRLVQAALKLVSIDVYKLKYPINDQQTLIARCVRENKIIQSPNLRDFFYPSFPKAEILERIQKILNFKLCIAAPVRTGSDNVIGAVLVVTKHKEINKSQLQLLQFYANLAGVAVDNNAKILALKEQYEIERETTSLLSHELKTPIAILYGKLQQLEKAVAVKETESGINLQDFQTDIDRIQETLIKMTQICNTILSLSEVESDLNLENQKLNLEQSLEPILENYAEAAANKGLNLDYQIQQIPETYGGAIQFEQILMILLDNAIKYTQKGEITIDINANTEQLICKVCDTGPGIATEDRKAIFDRFYRSDKHRDTASGLGLGLYIAAKITEKLAGSIDVTDNPDSKTGTCFTVRLPIYQTLTPQS